MAIYKYQIINLSLSHLGQASLTSTDDDDIASEETAQAVESLKVYDFALEETLRAKDWSFARREAEELSAATYDPDTYEYAYTYPANCVAIRKISSDLSPENTLSSQYIIAYDPDNDVKVILTDEEDAYIWYTYLVTNESLYEPHFVTAFSYRLAAALAKPLTGDDELAKNMIAIFNTQISEAHRHTEEEKLEEHKARKTSNIISARG